MLQFPELESCQDCSEGMFAFFSQTEERAASLLDQMLRVARPYECEAQILAFFSRITMRPWLLGDVCLTIDHVSQYDACFTLTIEHPNEDPEIMYQYFFRVSWKTILKILSFRNAILPFEIEGCSKERIVLMARTSKRSNTLPPSAFLLADAENGSDNPQAAALFVQIKQRDDPTCEDVSPITGTYFSSQPIGTLHQLLAQSDFTDNVTQTHRTRTIK